MGTYQDCWLANYHISNLSYLAYTQDSKKAGRQLGPDGIFLPYTLQYKMFRIKRFMSQKDLRIISLKPLQMKNWACQFS